METKHSSSFLLANIISVFHLLVVLFIIVIPFMVTVPSILFIHFLSALCIILHWVCNENVCSLSFMEGKLRGISYDKSFTHRFISPIYDISKTDWSKICYIITFSVMIFSIYKISTGKNLKNAKRYYKYLEYKTKQKTGNELNWVEKLCILKKCLPFMLTNELNDIKIPEVPEIPDVYEDTEIPEDSEIPVPEEDPQFGKNES